MKTKPASIQIALVICLMIVRVKLKKLFQMNGFIGKMKRVTLKKKLIEFFRGVR